MSGPEILHPRAESEQPLAPDQMDGSQDANEQPEIGRSPADLEQPEARSLPREESHPGDLEQSGTDGAAIAPDDRPASTINIEHPDWCDPAQCTATGNRGWHRSRPVEVRGSEATDLTLTAQLTAWPDGTGVCVDVTVTLVDLEGETTTDEWPIPAADALALGRVLVSLARRVKR